MRVFSMYLGLLMWLPMAACMLWLAKQSSFAAAFGLWSAIAAIACAFGGWAISSQPLEQSSMVGRLGFGIVRFGFRAGRGKLGAAILISFIVWLALGAAVMAIARAPHDRPFVMMVIAWAILGFGLFHLMGTIAMNRGSGGGMVRRLATMALIVAAMIAVSMVLWFWVGGEWGRRTALTIAGGPVAFVGGGYALFLLVVLIFGRKARWN